MDLTLSHIENAALIDLFKDMPTRLFSKNEIIVKPNTYYKYVYFVEKGLTRIFYLNSKGEDNTHWFSPEGELVTSLSSYYSKQCSPFGLQALENNTAVRRIAFDKLIELKSKNATLNSAYEKVIITVLISISKRVTALNTMDSRERYEQLLSDWPEVFTRANLGHIASYLGMTQQNLSRIRSGQLAC